MKKNTARGKHTIFLLIYTVLLIFILTSCKTKRSLTSNKALLLGFQIGAKSAWRTCNTQSIHEAHKQASNYYMQMRTNKKTR